MLCSEIKTAAFVLKGEKRAFELPCEDENVLFD